LQLTEKKLLLALTKSWKIFVKVETNMISATIVQVLTSGLKGGEKMPASNCAKLMKIGPALKKLEALIAAASLSPRTIPNLCVGSFFNSYKQIRIKIHFFF